MASRSRKIRRQAQQSYDRGLMKKAGLHGSRKRMAKGFLKSRRRRTQAIERTRQGTAAQV